MPGSKRRGPEKKRKSHLTRKRDKDDENCNLQEQKVEIAEILVRKLGISKLDAMIAYDSFHKKFPKGEISKENFLGLEENQVSRILSLWSLLFFLLRE